MNDLVAELAHTLSVAFEADRRANQCDGEARLALLTNAKRHRNRAKVLEDRIEVARNRMEHAA